MATRETANEYFPCWPFYRNFNIATPTVLYSSATVATRVIYDLDYGL